MSYSFYGGGPLDDLQLNANLPIIIIINVMDRILFIELFQGPNKFSLTFHFYHQLPLIHHQLYHLKGTFFINYHSFCY